MTSVSEHVKSGLVGLWRGVYFTHAAIGELAYDRIYHDSDPIPKNKEERERGDSKLVSNVLGFSAGIVGTIYGYCELSDRLDSNAVWIVPMAITNLARMLYRVSTEPTPTNKTAERT